MHRNSNTNPAEGGPSGGQLEAKIGAYYFLSPVTMVVMGAPLRDSALVMVFVMVVVNR